MERSKREIQENSELLMEGYQVSNHSTWSQPIAVQNRLSAWLTGLRIHVKTNRKSG